MEIFAGYARDMNLLFWKAKTKLEVVRVNSTDLRLKRWRSDETLLSAAKTLQGNNTYSLMVKVLKNEAEAMGRGLPLVATVNEQVALQRLVQGYLTCIEHMASMSEKPSKQKEVVENYAPENANPQKQNNKRPVPGGMGW